MKFSIYQTSRSGPRPYNEDRVAYAYSKDALLAIVADGLGGHLQGEVAAQFAIQVLTESFHRMALPALKDPFKFLKEEIGHVHNWLNQHTVMNDLAESPCTTIVAAIVQRDLLYCVHAGDSRLYHFRDGKKLFCTEDHSKVYTMFRNGLISRERMLTHPERSQIYNCISGDSTPQLELAPKHRLQKGDIVLLCSDGLWSLVDDLEIASVLHSGPMMESVPALFDLAGSRIDKHSDNMSAIAIQWGVGNSDGHCISTASMPLDGNNVVFSHGAPGNPEALTEDDSMDAIEYAIAEIQLAVKKSNK